MCKKLILTVYTCMQCLKNTIRSIYYIVVQPGLTLRLHVQKEKPSPHSQLSMKDSTQPPHQSVPG